MFDMPGLEGSSKKKNYHEPIRNQTCNLQACNAVPQQTAPPNTLVLKYYSFMVYERPTKWIQITMYKYIISLLWIRSAILGEPNVILMKFLYVCYAMEVERSEIRVWIPSMWWDVYRVWIPSVWWDVYRIWIPSVWWDVYRVWIPSVWWDIYRVWIPSVWWDVYREWIQCVWWDVYRVWIPSVWWDVYKVWIPSVWWDVHRVWILSVVGCIHPTIDDIHTLPSLRSARHRWYPYSAFTLFRFHDVAHVQQLH
jgi:hypothetical protein